MSEEGRKEGRKGVASSRTRTHAISRPVPRSACDAPTDATRICWPLMAPWIWIRKDKCMPLFLQHILCGETTHSVVEASTSAKLLELGV